PCLEVQGFKILLTRYAGELGGATAPITPTVTSGAEAAPGPAPTAGLLQAKPAAGARTNRPFSAADYELIQDEASLDEWIAEATKAGTVAFDVETGAHDANN